MSKIKFFSTAVFVKDIEVSKAFYSGLLELDVIHDFGKNVTYEGGLSIWELRDKHVISKQTKRADGHNFEAYFETENIDVILEKLNQNNVKFLHDMHTEVWGQQTIRFFDPDNHLIEIGEPLEVFVKRMSQTMSPENVSKNTSIPIETINRILDIDIEED